MKTGLDENGAGSVDYSIYGVGSRGWKNLGMEADLFTPINGKQAHYRAFMGQSQGSHRALTPLPISPLAIIGQSQGSHEGLVFLTLSNCLIFIGMYCNFNSQ